MDAHFYTHFNKLRFMFLPLPFTCWHQSNLIVPLDLKDHLTTSSSNADAITAHPRSYSQSFKIIFIISPHNKFFNASLCTFIKITITAITVEVEHSCWVI